MTRSPVAHIDDVALEHIGHGEIFSADLARLGPLIGLEQLGCCLTIAPMPPSRSTTGRARTDARASLSMTGER